MVTKTFFYSEPFLLESGVRLPNISLAYSTYGTRKPDDSTTVWVFHALTANSNPAEWWPGLVGDGKLFDPKQHFIICVNMPGSPYGSTSPLHVNAATGAQWLHNFPQFTVKDMVAAYKHLRDALGIGTAAVGIGGSMGGQQLLQWAAEEPQFFKTIVPLATNAVHSPWGIAFNATQRMCIEADASWKENKITAGEKGLQTARAVAMISYRSYQGYAQTQSGFYNSAGAIPQLSKAESYQRYQGKKLAERFNAFSYWHLSTSMDLHNLGRYFGSTKAALARIQSKAIVIGISSDGLFPVSEQEHLAQHIPHAQLVVIDSLFGHDGFLIESEAIQQALAGQLFDSTILKEQLITAER